MVKVLKRRLGSKVHHRVGLARSQASKITLMVDLGVPDASTQFQGHELNVGSGLRPACDLTDMHCFFVLDA